MASSSSPAAAAADSSSSSAGASAGAVTIAARSDSPLPAPPLPPPLPSKRGGLPPPCWTHDETLALIDSYRDKWYSLRRGNLRAAHWQEVADEVTLRCHALPAATPKTAVQCRHKVEKLRKRYRSDRLRSLSLDPSSPPSSSWIYFPNMDAMETGGTTNGNAAAGGGGSSNRPSPIDDDDNYRGGGGGDGGNTRTLRKRTANGTTTPAGLIFAVPKAIRSKVVSRAEERAPPPPPPPPPRHQSYNPYPPSSRSWGGFKPPVEKNRRPEKMRRTRARWGEREEEGGQQAMGELVAALQMLGDSFLRMEQMKMEMARETEKVRMEMELKRTETILDCQRRMAETLAKGFVGKTKRAKISPDS